MKYERDYAATEDCPRETQDVIALADLRQYLGAGRYNKLVALYNVPVEKRGPAWEEPNVFVQLRNTLGLISGVSGYPIAAFARKYILASWRNHMGDLVDEAGFPVKTEGAET